MVEGTGFENQRMGNRTVSSNLTASAIINAKMQKSFTQKVYDVVAKIPKGSTMTYKEVAVKIGNPNSYRAVGNALNKNPDTKKVPCHRVIRSNGTVGGYAWGSAKKMKLLKKERAL